LFCQSKQKPQDIRCSCFIFESELNFESSDNSLQNELDDYKKNVKSIFHCSIPYSVSSKFKQMVNVYFVNENYNNYECTVKAFSYEKYGTIQFEKEFEAFLNDYEVKKRVCV